LAGLLVFPIDQAKQVLTNYRELMKSAPEELNVWGVMRKAPPLPFLPEAVHGKEVIVLAPFYVGDANEGQKWIDRLRGFGTLHGEHVGPMPYTQWEQMFDPLLTPGFRNYWKSHNFTELSDAAINTMIEYAGKLPSPHCEIFLACISGAANRVAPDATAYRSRDAKFVLNVHSRWETAIEDQKCIGWARDFFKASQPFASTGAYVNFMTEEEGDRVPAFLFLPRGVQGKVPAILCLHQTTGIGKGEPAGLGGSPSAAARWTTDCNSSTDRGSTKNAAGPPMPIQVCGARGSCNRTISSKPLSKLIEVFAKVACSQSQQHIARLKLFR
jgi:hypothetical protein